MLVSKSTVNLLYFDPKRLRRMNRPASQAAHTNRKSIAIPKTARQPPYSTAPTGPVLT